MAIHKLGAGAVKRTTPGTFGDGGGLYLQISIAKDGKGRSRSWVFRYKIGKRTREMGLGSVDTVGLAKAREFAQWHRLQLLENIDPIEFRRADRAARLAAAARVMTFDQCYHGYVAAHRDAWRSQRHAAQWVQSVAKHVSPIIGKLPVAQIDTALVLRVLEPIWTKTPEAASRLRGRIEAVLDWATAREFRLGDNPARWEGHLETLLPSRSKLLPVVHHPALPYRDVPAFIARLREREGAVERALEFLILTAARTGEVLGARWDEIDGAVWAVPGSRMKSGREHRVPLSDRCIASLTERQARSGNSEFVFPGEHAPTMARSVFQRLLERMDVAGVTVHGFRSSFRDWCREQTNFPREVAEIALAHTNKDKTEEAYARGDALAKRRRLMDAWASYCGKPVPVATTGATVTPLQAGAAR
jgi:integrase